MSCVGPFAIPLHPRRCSPCAAAAYCRCALCRGGMLVGVRPSQKRSTLWCRISWVHSHQVEEVGWTARFLVWALRGHSSGRVRAVVEAVLCRSPCCVMVVFHFCSASFFAATSMISVGHLCEIYGRVSRPARRRAPRRLACTTRGW